jgi:hypothetical protein
MRTYADISDIVKKKIEAKRLATEEDNATNLKHAATEEIDAAATRDN